MAVWRDLSKSIIIVISNIADKRRTPCAARLLVLFKGTELSEQQFNLVASLVDLILARVLGPAWVDTSAYLERVPIGPPVLFVVIIVIFEIWMLASRGADHVDVAVPVLEALDYRVHPGLLKMPDNMLQGGEQVPAGARVCACIQEDSEQRVSGRELLGRWRIRVVAPVQL